MYSHVHYSIFIFQVKTDSMCYLSSSSTVNFPTSSFQTTMINNYNANPGMKWQYFGSELGAMTLFPAKKTCGTSYDPRFRYCTYMTIVYGCTKIVLMQR